MSTITILETSTGASTKSPIQLHLKKNDSLALKFTAFGDKFKSLLEENQRLNEELVKESEEVKSTFLEKELQALSLKEKVEDVTSVDFSEAEGLEKEIQEIKGRVLTIAKTIEATLRSKIFELETEIEKKKAEFKKERAGLDEIEVKVVEWQGKVNAYRNIKA